MGGSKRIKNEMIGNKYGKWTVIEYAGLSKNKKSQWLCMCDCGTKSIVLQGNLLNNISHQCKQCSYEELKKPRNDLSGKRFGKLLVIKYNGNRKYECLCDCGNRIVIAEYSLTTGNTKSCGCSSIGHNGSQQECQMTNTVKELYGESNVLKIDRVGKYRPDCILSYNNTLYDIEYDGEYWHNEEHDAIRDKYFVSMGYKVIRFVCHTRTITKSFVTKQQIIDAINSLENNDNFIYKQILQ